MRSLIVLRLVLPVVGINLLFGCSTAHTHAASQQTDIGPVASMQLPLKANGLPEGFFQPAQTQFPKNGRAALAPDGLHYASFEANELRIYSLTLSK
jgi:hypothetical protein